MTVEGNVRTLSDALFLKWARRLTAICLYGLIGVWVADGASPVAQLDRLLAQLPLNPVTFPIDRTVVVVAVLWYAYLTQLKIRWAVWLPFYFLLFPFGLLLILGLRVFGAPLGVFLKSLAADEASAVVTSAPTVKAAPAATEEMPSFPIKRVWLLLLFLWFVALRGLQLSWANWIPPVLMVPVWWFFLKSAYRCALAPRTFASRLARSCNWLLETQLKSLREAADPGKPIPPSVFAFSIARQVLKRYSDDRVLTVIQRESLLMFSGALLLALMASSSFWALVGLAARSTTPSAFSQYDYFASNSLMGAMLWAWGCMTTSVSFPVAAVPLGVRILHGCVVATGVFQLTFLLACFSIMTGAESQRLVDAVRGTLQETKEKLEAVRTLEAEVKRARAVGVTAASDSGNSLDDRRA